MSQQTYFCILTAVGEAKDANAKALGTALKFTEMAVGDGNGALPVPDRNRTALVRQVRRAPINTLKADPLNPGQVIVEQIIPENVGGWWIRELGLYDDAGDLVAIGNCAETYKPQLAEGSGRFQVVRMVLIMSSAATVQLKIDPAVVLATRKYVEEQDAAHVAAPDPHPQYTTAAESDAKIQAAISGKADLAGATFTGPVIISGPSKVGIGTQNPQAPLHVNGRAILGILGASGQNALTLNPDIAGSTVWHLKGGAAGYDGLAFLSGSDAYNTPSVRMYLTGTGAVGIGTTATREKLHVAGGGIAVSPDVPTIGTKVGSLSFIGYTGYAQPCAAGIESWIPAGSAGLDYQDLRFRTVYSINNPEVARFTFDGNFLVGTTSGPNHVIKKTVADGSTILYVSGGSGGTSVSICGVDSSAGSASTAIAALYVGRQSTTNRSLNAAGTINASGADYAEYMTKADDCALIEKGQIVGIDVNGLVTDKWDDSISFLIKSTNPSYVGGDVWGSPEALGLFRPEVPVLEISDYTGAPEPGMEPVAPIEPPMPAEPVKPEPPVEPPAPAAPETATDSEKLIYAVLLEQHEKAIAAQADAYQAAIELQAEQYQADLARHAAAMAFYQEQLAKYQDAKATYDIELAAFHADQAAYAEKIKRERQHFDTITMPTYQAELAKFEQLLEAARQRVDRIAYCGQVPVNVLGAKPGQYVVPVQDGEGIGGQLVDDAAVTFEQYRRAVGIVQNILPDGRANVRVKPV